MKRFRFPSALRGVLLLAIWIAAIGGARAQSIAPNVQSGATQPANYAYPPPMFIGPPSYTTPAYVAPVSYAEADAAPAAAGVSNSASDSQRQIDALEQRLAALEQQIQAPANQPIEPSSAGSGSPGVPAQPTGFASEMGNPPDCIPSGAVPILTTPTVHIGAKAILDNVQFSQNPASRKAVGGEEDFTGFRFLRVSFYGDLYENIDYRLEIDLAQAESATNAALLAAFQDVWVHFGELPYLGNVKVGFFKEPLGMEQQTREENLLFMERFLGNALVPGRRMGVMAYNDLNDDQSLTWYTGSFREGSGDKTFLEYSNQGDYGVTSRLAWVPLYQDQGRYLLHFGGSYEYTGADNNNANSKSIVVVPEVNAQTAVTSVTVPCQRYQLYGLEAALIDGPLTVQSEYIGAFFPELNGTQANVGSAYFETLYLLTGENHEYVKSGKFITGVQPYEPFFDVRSTDGSICRGWGAWEIGGRVSYIDLDQVGGARVLDYTAGIHWYLTYNCSTMLNYIHSEVTRGGGTTAMDIFGERIEWHF